MNTRRVIFSVDDSNVVYDIKGDNKLVFLDWKEEAAGLWPQKDLLDRITEFRNKNFTALD